MRFILLVSPDITVTWALDTPHKSLRNLRKYSLALPSTGGEVRRIFRAFPMGPTISLWDARG